MNSKGKLALGIGLTVAGITALNLGVTNNVKEKSQNSVAKEYVKKNAPEKYLNLIEKESNGKTIRWNKAVRDVKDSLRIDSMCKKAYFDGAQMVRDSIKDANTSILQIKQNEVKALRNNPISKTVVRTVIK